MVYIQSGNTAQALSSKHKVKKLVSRSKAFLAGKRDNLPAPQTGKTANVAYGTDTQQKLDIYPSETGRTNKTGKTRPAVIVVHGGGWHTGDKADVAWVASDLADQGFSVYNVNYRLATETQPGFPMQLDDMKTVIQWVQQYGGQYGTDTKDISLIGGSAGGHLVALTGTVVNDEAPGTISHVVPMSGPMDFTSIPADTDTAQLGSISNFLGCTLRVDCSDQILRDASPAYNVHKATCPAFYIANSSAELVPASQAQTMQSKLKAANCQSTLTIVPGASHAFGNYDQLEPEIVSFLRS